MLFDGTVDERSDVARSSARLISGFRDVQLAQELFEHLDRFLILRLGVGGIRRDRLHDVDGWHDGVEGIRSEEGGRFGGLWWLALVVIRELKTDWVSRKSEGHASLARQVRALFGWVYCNQVQAERIGRKVYENDDRSMKQRYERTRREERRGEEERWREERECVEGRWLFYEME